MPFPLIPRWPTIPRPAWRSNASGRARARNLLSGAEAPDPATGAIARTATNVRNGGRTPVAGIVHALFLVVVLVAAGGLAGLIPMASLAGVLVVVAYNMSEWHVFVRLLRGPRSDTLVLITTFVLTVAVDLTVAIQVGVVLAALLFMRRMADVTEVRAVKDILEYETEERAVDDGVPIPARVEVFEINGSFCFGAANVLPSFARATWPVPPPLPRGRPRTGPLRRRGSAADRPGARR